ncbi:MAG: nucleotide sugar dehydrogenase [Candidatus Dadabacteria bacterium]|nr:nucleotide sugar dehydrogenase [Candidatus Dadabacteria bacterium]
MKTKIAVVGMGYVGIPCAALLADVPDFDVTGIQRRSTRSGWKIDVLNAGKSPIEGDEPGLTDLLERVVGKGSFRVTDDFSAIKEMDAVLIDVQTPTDGAGHEPQYLSLKEVAREIGAYMKRGVLIITESTVAPGTTEHVLRPILERKSGLEAGKDFHLAYSYERVMPGKLIEYIVNLPRIVGGIDAESERRARELYAAIVKAPIHTTDVLTAETTKTIENAYRDVNIAFANEMALVCESLGINAYEVQRLINTRSERMMHYPGAGVGGHCLPKDTWLLLYGLNTYGKKKVQTHFVELARGINESMPHHLVDLLADCLRERGKDFRDAKVVILGVAYLENSDDTRNTPAYDVAARLTAHGAEVIAHDPYVREFPEVELTKDLEGAATGADALLIVTKHKDYYGMDLDALKRIMRDHIIVDGRDVIDHAAARTAGFLYRGIGKGNA